MHLNNYLIKDKKVVVATHNKGKVEEFKILFSKYNIQIMTSDDLSIDDVEETGKSFEENSIIKVKTIPNDYVAIADDSGLCVKILNQEPGIFSARYAKKYGGWTEAMKKIYSRVEEKKNPDFSAKFVSCLSLKLCNGKIFTYIGEIKGKITWPPKGDNGFGYDPFFIPIGENLTYGEVEYSTKILSDHRSVAFKKLARVHLRNS